MASAQAYAAAELCRLIGDLLPGTRPPLSSGAERCLWSCVGHWSVFVLRAAVRVPSHCHDTAFHSGIGTPQNLRGGAGKRGSEGRTHVYEREWGTDCTGMH